MNAEMKLLIDLLALSQHPEGGYYRETFRATLLLDNLPDRGPRNASTLIYFLLPAGTFSAFHLVKGSDEIWHHYTGDPVELHTITHTGHHSTARLGPDIAHGERPQAVIPAGTLQAARPSGKNFALCGCTVAPGFDFDDFVMPTRSELLREFPAHRMLVEQFTRDS